jgi:hypothetical protein
LDEGFVDMKGSYTEGCWRLFWTNLWDGWCVFDCGPCHVSVLTITQSILNMPEKVAVTAKLALNYRAPTRADQFVIIKTKIVEKNGRKMTVFGSIETLDGTVLCDAT